MKVEMSVAGRPIPAAVIYREAQYHPEQSWERACHAAARALAIRELMLEQARRLELWDGQTPLSERAAQDLVDEVTTQCVPVPQVSDAECQEFFLAHSERFVGPELFEASHILFARPGDAQDESAVIKKAEGLLAELVDKPHLFERRARELSACPSGSSGGRLGQLTPGETTEPFENALRDLEPGSLCPRLVETRHGFHVVRLDEFSSGRALPFSAVEHRIRLYLREKSWRSALQRFLRELAGSAPLTGLDLDAPPPSEVRSVPEETQPTRSNKARRLPVLH